MQSEKAGTCFDQNWKSSSSFLLFEYKLWHVVTQLGNFSVILQDSHGLDEAAGAAKTGMASFATVAWTLNIFRFEMGTESSSEAMIKSGGLGSLWPATTKLRALRDVSSLNLTSHKFW